MRNEITNTERTIIQLTLEDSESVKNGPSERSVTLLAKEPCPGVSAHLVQITM
jgi:hypothetical protein